MQSEKRVLTRTKHGLITGTLRGLAEYYGLNLNGLQFVFLIAAFCGVGLVLYFVLWVSIPSYSQREKLIESITSNEE